MKTTELSDINKIAIHIESFKYSQTDFTTKNIFYKNGTSNEWVKKISAQKSCVRRFVIEVESCGAVLFFLFRTNCLNPSRFGRRRRRDREELFSKFLGNSRDSDRDINSLLRRSCIVVVSSGSALDTGSWNTGGYRSKFTKLKQQVFWPNSL